MGFWIYDVFLFKQKTAYEMRISDWSSDVCSSDLRARRKHQQYAGNLRGGQSRRKAGLLRRDLRCRRNRYDARSRRGIKLPRWLYARWPDLLEQDRKSVV